MAGRIREEDIAEVREKTRIDDVVSSYVTLRNAGGGSMKGLCPFHDEKSASFHVTPSRGFYHCFGCQAGGDVIKFVMEMDGLGFTETVERLAEKAGVQLRYEEGGAPRPRTGPHRPRLVEAHKHAGEWYAEQLATPEALTARQFLDSRGFDADAAATFGVGFSPRGGEDLLKHLRQKGFTDEELVTSGLIGEGRGLYDRFRGRLMWPIRDSSGDTIGFGARRIFDDDRIEAKYLNTPETPIYKKSQVLYGIDLARREIARASQAVIVEGYTDVMACHLAGVKTAVATCGTSFGDDHARVIRRLLHDHDEFRGEVIFTFDGDEAGQKAALRAFEGDQIFAGQTYVAVEPSGLDPCDLRLKQGDAEVRELVARRVPLYRFVLANVVQRYDLDRADGRVDAMREAAKLVTAIRDRSKVDAFSRELAGMLGIEPADVQREVRKAAARGAGPHARGPARQAPDGSGRRAPRSARAAADAGARDAQARRTAPGRGRSDRQGRGRRGLHPRCLPGAVGRDPGGRRADRGGCPVAVDPARRADRRAAAVADQCARRRAALLRQAARRGLRGPARPPAAGADRDASHRRPEVAVAAHQPGGAGDGVQPDVRRAGRPRAAPPQPA